MQIQLNTDKNITGSDSLQEKVENIIKHELKHVADEVTRIEVHLNDVNTKKGGLDDKRCMLEARIAGMQPVSTEHRAETVDMAVKGAAEQLTRALKTALAKARTSSRDSIKHADPSVDEPG